MNNTGREVRTSSRLGAGRLVDLGGRCGPAGARTGLAASNSGGTGLFAVDGEDRAEVVRFHETVYQASRGVDSMWNGDIGNCDPGTNSLEYAEATILRVNYFRAMAVAGRRAVEPGVGRRMPGGCPGMRRGQPRGSCDNLRLALLHARRGPSGSNLQPAPRGPRPNCRRHLHGRPWAENGPVGHRRWLMYPPQRLMGTASIPSVAPHYGVNVLRAVGGHGPRPVAPEWVVGPEWPTSRIRSFPPVHGGRSRCRMPTSPKRT
jgi:hypothetical protein